MATPLRNLKMLDLSRQLPGPFCSMMLADLGVDVLVVTSPKDPMGIGLPMVQRNKRSMTLNLKEERGRELFRQLLADADIVLEGFRPGVTERLGIDYDSVAKVNPRAIYCSISGYGQDGPYRDKVGHDINYLGYSGVLGVSGAADGPPQIMPVQVADIGGGALMAVVGILSALIARDTTGRGQFIDISMMDGSVLWNAYHILMEMIMKSDPERGKTQLTGQYPCYAVYETKDGRHVTVGAIEPHFWANLCNALELPDLIPDQFAKEPRRSEVFAALRAKFLEKTMTEWVEMLEPIDICFGPVNTVSESYNDPQVVARKLIHKIEGQTLVASPLKFSDTEAAAPAVPPTFGQHTDEVLAGLGIGEDDIKALRETGIV